MERSSTPSIISSSNTSLALASLFSQRKKQEKVGKVATTTSLRDRMLKKRKKSVK